MDPKGGAGEVRRFPNDGNPGMETMENDGFTMENGGLTMTHGDNLGLEPWNMMEHGDLSIFHQLHGFWCLDFGVRS